MFQEFSIHYLILPKQGGHSYLLFIPIFQIMKLKFSLLVLSHKKASTVFFRMDLWEGLHLCQAHNALNLFF